MLSPTFIHIRFHLHMFQTVLPLIIQFLIMIHSYQQDKLQLRIQQTWIRIHQLMIVERNCDWWKSSEFNFIKYLSIIFIFRLSILLLHNVNYYVLIFILNVWIPEIVFSTNDLQFVYHIESLTNKVKLLNNLLVNSSQIDKKLNDEFFQNIVTLFRRQSQFINERFSFGLFMTITYNYILVIICFYWLFVRISFNHFTTISGKFIKINFNN